MSTRCRVRLKCEKTANAVRPQDQAAHKQDGTHDSKKVRAPDGGELTLGVFPDRTLADKQSQTGPQSVAQTRTLGAASLQTHVHHGLKLRLLREWVLERAAQAAGLSQRSPLGYRCPWHSQP